MVQTIELTWDMLAGRRDRLLRHGSSCFSALSELLVSSSPIGRPSHVIRTRADLPRLQQALLGIHDLGPNDPNAQLTSHSTMAAGVRREQACRSLHERTVYLTYELDEILHDTTPVNFEALMVEVQMLACEFWSLSPASIGAGRKLTFFLTVAEFVPRKSRTLIRLAFGQFQELQNSTLSDKVKQELSRAYSLPLFVSEPLFASLPLRRADEFVSILASVPSPSQTCDAITSAYARKSPIITVADCRQYLGNLSIPNVGVDLLEQTLERYIPQGLPKGTLTHELLVHATHEVHAWLGQAQRTFAEMAVRELSSCS